MLHLYENFTYSAHTPMFRDYVLGADKFEVAHGVRTPLAHHAAGAVPPCSHGRWMLGEEFRCVLTRLRLLSDDRVGTGVHAPTPQDQAWLQLAASAVLKRGPGVGRGLQMQI